MITDWIRMRTDIYRDPKVLIIANALARHESVTCHEAVTKFRDIHVTRHAVVGALVTIWGTMRHSGHAEGNDLFCNRINLSILDGICDLPGFGSAMAEAGWAIETDEGVIFPGFFADLNSVPTGKKASTAAERQRRCREKKSVTKCHEMSRDSHTADSHAVTQCHTLEEKRREEKRENTEPPLPPGGVLPKKPPAVDSIPIPANLDDPEFREAWELWKQHRREKKKPLTPTSTKQQLAKLSEWGIGRALAAIRHSIANGWQGIFEPQEAAAAKPPPKRFETNSEKILRQMKEAGVFDDHGNNSKGNENDVITIHPKQQSIGDSADD